MVESSDRHQLSTDAVADFLREHGWRDVTDLERIAHGEWSRAFGFAIDHRAEYVVRFSTLEDDFRKDQLAARWREPRLPMPEILEVGEVFDGFYAISERTRGQFLDLLDPEQMRQALPSLFATIDALRQADVSGTRGFGLWDATGQAPHASWRDALLAIGSDTTGSRITGWRARLEQSPTGAAPFDTAFKRLAELVDALPNARHLLHSDLLAYNVLVEADCVTAVLDWGSAMYGDWLYDVAWLTFWQLWYPAWSGIDIAGEAQRYFAAHGGDLADYTRRIRAYEIVIGLDDQAYCAFKGESRWPQLETVARRTLERSD